MAANWRLAAKDYRQQRMYRGILALGMSEFTYSRLISGYFAELRPCIRDSLIVVLSRLTTFVKIGIAPLARKPTLSRHLRDARIQRGLSVAEVAERAGVSVASIYLWETGKTHPRDANLSALCKVLKLPIRATRELAAG
jgi:DNA-binding XRE family transcriptional regulator